MRTNNHMGPRSGHYSNILGIYLRPHTIRRDDQEREPCLALLLYWRAMKIEPSVSGLDILRCVKPAQRRLTLIPYAHCGALCG
jgi:hypothetical protein